MGAHTGIEWTDATWNPIEGCSMAKGSEKGGCLNCYAARTALRRPASGLAVMRDSGPRWTGKVGLVESRLELPLHWRKPKRIFVNSMSDLFHEALPDEVIDRVFAVMALSPQHTFQVLTKRPERMAHYVNGNQHGHICDIARRIQAGEHNGGNYPLPNVWLGVSVEDQATLEARVPDLLQTPAARRFLSYEPALGALDLSRVLNYGFRSTRELWLVYLDWVIAGGESGPGARPAHPDWFRSVRNQCEAAGVPFFFKQWGEVLPAGQISQFLPNEFKQPSNNPIRYGKKAAGALLDGVEWKQFPS